MCGEGCNERRRRCVGRGVMRGGGVGGRGVMRGGGVGGRGVREEGEEGVGRDVIRGGGCGEGCNERRVKRVWEGTY